MSWQYVPSLFRLPEIPGFTPPDGIWRGTGRDEGDYAVYRGPWGGDVIGTRGRCAPSRAGVRRGRVCAQRSELVAALVLPVHCQLAISGRSTPCAAIYCRCSTSLSRICCTA